MNLIGGFVEKVRIPLISGRQLKLFCKVFQLKSPRRIEIRHNNKLITLGILWAGTWHCVGYPNNISNTNNNQMFRYSVKPERGRKGGGNEEARVKNVYLSLRTLSPLHKFPVVIRLVSFIRPPSPPPLFFWEVIRTSTWRWVFFLTLPSFHDVVNILWIPLLKSPRTRRWFFEPWLNLKDQPRRCKENAASGRKKDADEM